MVFHTETLQVADIEVTVIKKDVKNMEATIDEAVKDIFVKFPVLDAQL